MAKPEGQRQAAPLKLALPSDVEAERQILATIGASGAEVVAAEVRAFLDREDFFHNGYGLMFEAIGRLLDQHMEIHPVSIRDEMGDECRRVGGFEGIVEILSFDEAQRPMELAELLRRKRKQRTLMKMADEALRAAAQDDEAPEDLSERMVRDLYALGSGDTRRRGLIHVDEITDEVLANVAERANIIGSGGLDLRRPVPTGLFKLDEAMSGGFEPGQLIILAARPGVGKSTLVGNWVQQALVGATDPVVVFNLEMSKNEVWQRLLSSYRRMDIKKLVAPKNIDSSTMDVLQDASYSLRGAPLYIADDAVVTVPFIQAELTRLHARTGKRPRMVVIDYLQLLSSPPDSRGAKQSEAVRIGEISRGLKILAREFQTPVVVLSQLNREVEHRAGGRPQLSDLRDSGAIEQDADMVVFINRRVTTAERGAEDITEVYHGKHRNGPLAEQQTKFLGEIFTFESIVRETSSTY